MNQENDRVSDTQVDPLVSDQIKALADETTPDKLDQAVMREAKRAIRADNRKGSFGTWFRPLAFMATVGLSLAIILDLSGTSIFRPAAEPIPVNRMLDTPARDANQATLNELKRQEKSSVAEPGADDTPATGVAPPDQGRLSKLRSEPPTVEHAQAGDAFSAESRKAAKRLQDVEVSYDTGAQEPSAAAPQLAAPQPAMEAMSVVAPAECSEVERSAADTWWQCIESLRKAGRIEAANRQLESLRSEFPDFVPPE